MPEQAQEHIRDPAAHFTFEPAKDYPWMVHAAVTVATITFGRLELTRRLVESLLHTTHLPIRLLIVDQNSTDGTQAYLKELSHAHENVLVLKNRKNVGKARALLQIQQEVKRGLLVYFDNDLEILSNFWLLQLQKAFHALRLRTDHRPTALGLRMVNQEEYGFRFAHRREVLQIPREHNALPRTSYAMYSKETREERDAPYEEVVFGFTEFLCGGNFALDAAAFQQVALERLYPKYIGGVDGFFSAECKRLGIDLAFVENGPITRHNDWPYSEDKRALYSRLTQERAVLDRHVLLERVKRLFRRS